MICPEKEVKVVNPQHVNWEKYFLYIKEQCPWSWSAWTKNLIWIGNFSNNKRPLENYQARMYIVKNINPRMLKKLAKKLDSLDTQCEWLWSHPRYKKYSTPVPVLIQQDRNKLRQLRTSLNKVL